MTDRYDLLTSRTVKQRDGTEKTYYTKVGVMFAMKGDKDGFNLKFEALPIPRIYDGNISVDVVAFPPKDNDEGGGRQQTQQRAAKPAPDLDDDIPF